MAASSSRPPVPLPLSSAPCAWQSVHPGGWYGISSRPTRKPPASRIRRLRYGLQSGSRRLCPRGVALVRLWLSLNMGTLCVKGEGRRRYGASCYNKHTQKDNHRNESHWLSSQEMELLYCLPLSSWSQSVVSSRKQNGIVRSARRSNICM